jgi:hypothetical protein
MGTGGRTMHQRAKKLCRAMGAGLLLVLIVLPLAQTTASHQAYALASTRGAQVKPASPRVNGTTADASGMQQENSSADPIGDYPPGIQPPNLKEDKKPKELENGGPFNPQFIKDAPDDTDETGLTDYLPWNWGKTVGKKVTGWVWNAVNGFVLRAVRGAFKSVMGFVATYIFADINFKTEGKILSIYTNLSWIVGGIFALLVIIVALKTIMGAAFSWNNYRVKVLLPRMCLAAFMALFALPICQLFVNASHSMSLTIINMFQPESNLLAEVSSDLFAPATTGHALSFLALVLAAFMVLGFVFLGLFYLVRKVALIFLAIVAPLAFVFWIDEGTSNYTTLWARAFFSLVFIEVIHSLLVLLMFNILFSKGDALANVLYCFACLYLFWKIPSVFFQSTVIHWGPRATTTAKDGLALSRVTGMLGA